jgi:hypothetical protein
MTTLLFYENPIPLNTDLHLNTRIKQIGDFRFASPTNSIPIAAGEFVDAAREYPIAFTGEQGNALFPIALLGVRKNENLFVTPAAEWDGSYIPAFVRRYPFVLAEKLDADDFNVYIDEAYEGFGKKDGARLFSDDGEPSVLLTQAMDFLSSYQGEIIRTRTFMERLQELDLLVPRVLQVERKDATPIVLEGFSVVDEERLVALEDTQLLDLARSGYLIWIYAHLMSLGNVSRLSMRLDQRISADEQAAIPEKSLTKFDLN